MQADRQAVEQKQDEAEPAKRLAVESANRQTKGAATDRVELKPPASHSDSADLPVPRRGREGLESLLFLRSRVFWGRSLPRTDSGHSPWQREPLLVLPLAPATPLAHSSGRSST